MTVGVISPRMEFLTPEQILCPVRRVSAAGSDRVFSSRDGSLMRPIPFGRVKKKNAFYQPAFEWIAL